MARKAQNVTVLMLYRHPSEVATIGALTMIVASASKCQVSKNALIMPPRQPPRSPNKDHSFFSGYSLLAS
jgi:hypothetical protein